MGSSIKNLEISKVGANIRQLVVNTVKPNNPEFHALVGIKSVVPTYNAGIGRSGIDNPTVYPHTDQLMITVVFHNEHAVTPIRFDIQTVSNQAGWTPDFAGLTQAALDIAGWITSVAPGGGGGALATEDTLALLLAEAVKLTTPVKRAHLSGDNIGAGAGSTTDNIKMAMLTCVNGVESINGIIRPAGVYIFEPQRGEDTIESISFNPNAGGRIITDELI